MQHSAGGPTPEVGPVLGEDITGLRSRDAAALAVRARRQPRCGWKLSVRLRWRRKVEGGADNDDVSAFVSLHEAAHLLRANPDAAESPIIRDESYSTSLHHLPRAECGAPVLGDHAAVLRLVAAE